MYCRVAATFRNVFKTLVLLETATSKALRLFYFMTRKERCELAIKRGYTYDPETGIIYNRFNNKVDYIQKDGYMKFSVKVNNKLFAIGNHRFAWYWVNKECPIEIDHINNIRNDNRIYNLRAVTRQQNQWNRKNVKGYYFNKVAKKWYSYIRINKIKTYLGYYNTEEEARNAYLQAKEIYHKI